MESCVNWQTLKTFLNTLQPNTLARMVIDIEDAQDDWEHYPEEAPSAATRKQINQVLGYIMKLGVDWGETADFDFAEMIEQVRAEQPADDWLLERDQQDQENWTQDLQ